MGADTRAIADWRSSRHERVGAPGARERPPEEFVVAGWRPEIWSPADLLNRTDAFVDSGDAIAEIARARLGPAGRGRHPARRHAAVLCRVRRAAGEHGSYDHPSRRWASAHLHARRAGNVIGATAPVAAGRVNRAQLDRIALGTAPG